MAASKSGRKATKKSVGRSAKKATKKSVGRSAKKATKKSIGKSVKNAAKRTGKALRRAASGVLSQLGGPNQVTQMAGRAAAAAAGQLAADLTATSEKKTKRAKKKSR